MANETEITKLLIRNHLLAQDAIQAKVGDRILGGAGSDEDRGSTPHPMIVIILNSGGGLYNSILQTVGFDLITFSKASQSEAAQLYDLCYNALNAECLSDPSLDMSLLVVEQDRPQEGFNGPSKAYFSQGRYIAQGAG